VLVHIAGKRVRIYSKSVNFCAVMATLPVRKSFTGWLAPRWPNFNLNVDTAEREAENLMAETDAKDRFFPHQTMHGFMGIGKRSRVARTIERKIPSGFNASVSSALVVAGTTSNSKAFLPQ